jgi:hypothetical protein
MVEKNGNATWPAYLLGFSIIVVCLEICSQRQDVAAVTTRAACSLHQPQYMNKVFSHEVILLQKQNHACNSTHIYWHWISCSYYLVHTIPQWRAQMHVTSIRMPALKQSATSALNQSSSWHYACACHPETASSVWTNKNHLEPGSDCMQDGGKRPRLSHQVVQVCCLPVGATALGEPWPTLQPVSTVWFLNKIVSYRMGLSAPCPTPIPEDQGVSLSLDYTLWPYRHGWPCW